MKKSDLARRTDASTCKMIPEGFTPGAYEVLIGRGRRCTMHWGNQRFRAMIDAELPRYTAAQDCKRRKSAIIGRVLADIQLHSPHAGFVKKDVGTGRWLSLTDAASRVTIAQAFRDSLVGSYRSSKHSKQVKRRIQKKNSFDKQGPKLIKTQVHEVLQELTMTRVAPLKMQETSFQDSFTVVASIVADAMSYDEPSESGEFELIGNEEFKALFDAFAGGEVNMEDNPFEPLPIASMSESAPSFRTSMHHKPASREPFNRSSVPTSTLFGTAVPYRDVRCAMSA